MLLHFFLVAGLLQAVPATRLSPHPSASYVPNRVYDTAAARFIDFEVLVATIAKADVVFIGEQHDDPNTHRLEAAILEGLQRRNARPVVSLEMFELDVQPLLDRYLAGQVTENELVKGGRPWPRYATDYRPLVESAKQHGWPVIAANVPRRLASAVSKSGREALAQLPELDKTFVARDLQCPNDAYFERFAKSMSGHPGGTQTEEEKQAALERYYWAQCVKDETMAESIAAATVHHAGARPIVHYNGAFHSDFGLGTAERVRRRLPTKRTIVITMLPVSDLDAVAPAGEDLKRADYLVYTLSTPKSQLPTPKLP